jgi:hypothetical protein
MGKQQLNTMDIFNEYVQLRQNGITSDTAGQQLQSYVDGLDKLDRQQLSRLVKTWEIRNDANAVPATAAVSHAKSTAIKRISPKSGGKKLEEADKLCPLCRKPNPQNELYCYSCGHILEWSSQSGTKSLDDPEMDANTRWGTAHFGQFSTLYLVPRGASEPIEVTLKNETIIGRLDKEAAAMPDVDLSPFNGEDLGVSRLHVSLKRRENTIAVADLNSKNFTYVNGQRLHPQEIRVLRDGDELRLGKLTMKVMFKHQLRRLQGR